jgi:hypothetical protein
VLRQASVFKQGRKAAADAQASAVPEAAEQLAVRDGSRARGRGRGNRARAGPDVNIHALTAILTFTIFPASRI